MDPTEGSTGLGNASSRADVVTDPVGYEIDFSQLGTGYEFLVSGWSGAEPNFTWTLGSESLIVFPCASSETDYALSFAAHPTDLRQSGQRATFGVNGEIIARLLVKSPLDLVLYIPREILAGHAAVAVMLTLPDAVSPAEMGTSSDSRQIALAARTMRFYPLLSNPSKTRLAPIALDREIMMNFQSLGANCELGFVQRHVGADTLGLLRWASSPLPKLTVALKERFQGYGDAANLELVVDHRSEFLVLDKKFGFRNHSFAFRDKGATASGVLTREIARIPFLIRKLIEELEDAKKLFAFHDGGRSGVNEIEELLGVIHKYNQENMLLWVCLAPDSKSAGTVTTLRDGLLVGFVDRFCALDDVQNVSYDNWLKLCRRAYDIWSGRIRSNFVS